MSVLDSTQKEYNNIIAPYYDNDPGNILSSSFEQAILQIQNANLLKNETPLRVLDIGIGTGSFLAQLKSISEGQLKPFGLDPSEKMLDLAYQKLPDLQAVVDTATNLDKHFSEQRFDLICTHFITAYVPMDVLAPKIWNLLDEGGYWSLVGSTMKNFPGLQKIANSLAFKPFKLSSKSSKLLIKNVFENPQSQDELLNIFKANNFDVCEIQTFEPKIELADMEEFLNFGYRGGWLTPYIEQLGLHHPSTLLTFCLNHLFFPMQDNLSIEIALVQKGKTLRCGGYLRNRDFNDQKNSLFLNRIWMSHEWGA